MEGIVREIKNIAKDLAQDVVEKIYVFSCVYFAFSVWNYVKNPKNSKL
jgi:hypothetical protein